VTTRFPLFFLFSIGSLFTYVNDWRKHPPRLFGGHFLSFRSNKYSRNGALGIRGKRYWIKSRDRASRLSSTSVLPTFALCTVPAPGPTFSSFVHPIPVPFSHHPCFLSPRPANGLCDPDYTPPLYVEILPDPLRHSSVVVRYYALELSLWDNDPAPSCPPASPTFLLFYLVAPSPWCLFILHTSLASRFLFPALVAEGRRAPPPKAFSSMQLCTLCWTSERYSPAPPLALFSALSTRPQK